MDYIERSPQEGEAYSLDKIAIVRTLSAPPRMIDGRFILETAFQTSRDGRPRKPMLDGVIPQGPIPRITLHFTLNAGVQEVSGGSNWFAADWVVIGNLQEVIAQNPTAHLVNLLGGDTFFEVPPESTFEMPRDTVLIMPERASSQTGVPKPSHITTYKAHDFGTADYEVMYQSYGKAPGMDGVRLGKDHVMRKFIALDEIFKLVSDFAHSEGLNQNPPYDGILVDGTFTQQFADYVRKTQRIDILRYYDMYTEMLCRHHAKEKKIADVLTEKGYDVLLSGDDSWHDQVAHRRLLMTAKELGVNSSRHSNMIYKEVETLILGWWQGIYTKEEVETALIKKSADLTPELKKILVSYNLELN